MAAKKFVVLDSPKERLAIESFSEEVTLEEPWTSEKGDRLRNAEPSEKDAEQEKNVVERLVERLCGYRSLDVAICGGFRSGKSTFLNGLRWNFERRSDPVRALSVYERLGGKDHTPTFIGFPYSDDLQTEYRLVDGTHRHMPFYFAPVKNGNGNKTILHGALGCGKSLNATNVARRLLLLYSLKDENTIVFDREPREHFMDCRLFERVPTSPSVRLRGASDDKGFVSAIDRAGFLWQLVLFLLTCPVVSNFSGKLADTTVSTNTAALSLDFGYASIGGISVLRLSFSGPAIAVASVTNSAALSLGFDEAWETACEGPQAAYWGIWDRHGYIKPEWPQAEGEAVGAVGTRYDRDIGVVDRRLVSARDLISDRSSRNFVSDKDLLSNSGRVLIENRAKVFGNQPVTNSELLGKNSYEIVRQSKHPVKEKKATVQAAPRQSTRTTNTIAGGFGSASRRIVEAIDGFVRDRRPRSAFITTEATWQQVAA